MKDIGSKEWVNLAASFDMSWQEKVDDIFKYYTEKHRDQILNVKK